MRDQFIYAVFSSVPVWIPVRYSQEGYTRIIIETSRGHLITLQDPRRFENIQAGDYMNVRVQTTQRGNVRYSLP